jgi:hypothetical protein
VNKPVSAPARLGAGFPPIPVRVKHLSEGWTTFADIREVPTILHRRYGSSAYSVAWAHVSTAFRLAEDSETSFRNSMRSLAHRFTNLVIRVEV